MQFSVKFYNTFASETLSIIAWFSCLVLWKIDDKWPFIFHVWQIFWSQRKHKNEDEFLRKNSWNVCPVNASQYWNGWPGMSAELPVNSVENIPPWQGFLTIILTILVRSKWITIFLGFLFHCFHLRKCRFFAFSRIFDLLDEIFEEFAKKSYREPWKVSLLIHFVQINSLTVAFLTE